jgi:putative protease
VQLRKLEILAPAKNREIGIAAIDCGADSLYIAGPSFGARESAGNPVSEIASLKDYARKFGVKIYGVLNTILYDSELAEAVEIAWSLFRAGCDALIIQDLGLLKCNLPPVPLFASTQTNIRTPEQAVFLEQLGFDRLILARELSLRQIREIREKTTVQLESFVHGALCVSYSGQCYMSSRVTGRSGNRGECAQLCRNLYTLEDNQGRVLVKDKPLLSLKDLDMSGKIPELVAAGVTSFKIEGRLKDISYVKNVVRYYRQVVDDFISSNEGYVKASSGSLHGGFSPDLSRTFNRGYTTLFADEVRGKWNSGNVAVATGEFIGRVKSPVKNNKGEVSFLCDTFVELSNGDGLCFVDSGGAAGGARVNVVNGNRITLFQGSVPVEGALIYRNYNRLFEKELEKNMPLRLVNVSLRVRCEDSLLCVEAESESGVEASVEKQVDASPARNSALARDSVYRQLSKRSGHYNFVVKEYITDNELFFSASFLNGIRRDLAAELEKNDTPPPVGAHLKKARYHKSSADYRENIANSRAAELYLESGVDDISMAFELQPPDEAELMRCKYCVKAQLDLCGAELQEPLWLVNNGTRYRVEFDCKNCEMVIFG